MSKKNETQTTPSSLSRRTVISGGAAVVGGLLAGQLMAPGTAEAAQRSKSTGPTDDSFTVMAVGEFLATRPFSMHTEPEFLEVVKLLRGSDLTFGHLEMNFGTDEELKWTPRGTAGIASYLIASPRIAEDIKWAGVDIMSLPNNHSFDWGPEGVLSTLKHCREAGLVVAGTGRNLDEARAPAYVEKDKARVALVALASGNNLYEWAGRAKAEIPGRPGINPLRVSTRYEVDHASAEQLKAIGRKLGVLSAEGAAKKEFNITPGGGVGGTGAAAFSFVDGDKFDISSTGHAKDIEENLRSIDEAGKLADFVIVSHQNATSEGSRGDTPSDFVIDFARKAIDAGADMYCGHGWHNFLGIEIYKGKPILYGMANFFYQTASLTRIPADSYESYGYDMDTLPKLNPVVGNLHPGGGDDWYCGAVYELKFVNKQIAQIILHPIELGMDFSSGTGKLYRSVSEGEHKYINGIPQIARGASGQEILKRLQKRCVQWGTRMEIKDGVGVITVA